MSDGLITTLFNCLLDYSLSMSLCRLYGACSLSDILDQLREARLGSGSLSTSVDMLLDLDMGPAHIPDTLTVSITADSLKLDSNGSLQISVHAKQT